MQRGEPFSDDDDDSGFQDSDHDDDEQGAKREEQKLLNQPYDEAVELSAELSPAGGDAGSAKEKKLKNDKYDEAFEVSGSPTRDAAIGINSPRCLDRGGSGGEEKQSGGGGGEAKRLGGGGGSAKEIGVVNNKPFDEAYEIEQSDDERSVNTVNQHGAKSPRTSPTRPGHSTLLQSIPPGGGDGSSLKAAQVMQQQAQQQQQHQQQQQQQQQVQQQQLQQQQQHMMMMQQQQQMRGISGGTESDGSESPTDEEDDPTMPKIEGSYNPKDYAYLQVGQEIKDLFLYISGYKAHDLTLDTQLKCFIPDYLPAVGDMDAFLKMPRPDGLNDDLGIKVLDEPAANQSDATVLELQMRAISKKQHGGDVTVRSIESAAKNTQDIDKWIASINDLHRSKPPPQVHYKKNMPDIDQLMDVWPEEFEDAIGKMALPNVDLSLSLEEYARIVCSILDIPIYDGSLVESLHVLFTLYLEFKNNQHFMAAGQNPQGAAMLYGGGAFPSSSPSLMSPTGSQYK